jgi:TRAP-type mannitol/chloroaromatic compound transport system substrate-binding protein
LLGHTLLSGDIRSLIAWREKASVQSITDALYAKYNIKAISCGVATGYADMWSRKEILTARDLRGMRIRMWGVQGILFAGALGTMPQQIPGGEIYSTLEKGIIDATTWMGPYDDEKLGFYKVAPYYYYPADVIRGAVMDILINLKLWNSWPTTTQNAIKSVCEDIRTTYTGKYEQRNREALQSLIAKGVKVSRLPPDAVSALKSEWKAFGASKSESNPTFHALWNTLPRD